MNNNINNFQGANMKRGANIPYIDDEAWMKGFEMGVDEIREEYDDGPKMNIDFKTTNNTRHVITVNYGTTIGQLLNKYLILIGRPDLIVNKSNEIVFLYNSYKLRFVDETPVEEFFKFDGSPSIIVNEVNNLPGGNSIL